MRIWIEFLEINKKKAFEGENYAQKCLLNFFEKFLHFFGEPHTIHINA